MTTESSESVPVMPDVKAVQREARRMMAISKWPLHMTSAVVVTACGACWGLCPDEWFAVPVFVMGLWCIALGLFRKQIQRVFLGANTPMIYARGDSTLLAKGRREMIAWIAGLLAGGIAGLLAAMLAARQDTHIGVYLPLASILGIWVAQGCYTWMRTHLWEHAFMSALLLVMLADVLLVPNLFQPDMEKSHLGILPCALLLSYVFAISFFLRWRKWVKSLPETVKTEEA